MTDLLLNVPESSGPELAKARTGLAIAEAHLNAVISEGNASAIPGCEASIKRWAEQVADLEAAEMQRRVSL